MDDLRETLEQAVNDSVKDEDIVVESTPKETSEQTLEVAAPQDASTPVADVPSDGVDAPSGKPIIDEVVETPPVDEKRDIPQSKVDTAPASWKGDAKELWAELPIKAREEITRRELQTQKVLNDTALDRKRVQEVTDVIQPHMDMIGANYGGNPMHAIGGLLNVERSLTVGNPATKAQIVAQIIKNYNIDIKALDSLLSGSELSPEMKHQSELDRLVNERLAPVMGYVQQQQQRERAVAQQRRNSVISTVEDMSFDSVNFPYFDEVREDMADIIEMSAKRGVDISLNEAYSKAIKFNGRTANAMSNRQNANADTQSALQAHQIAQKAKGASVSVSGNPTSLSPNAPVDTDLRSLISDALGNGGGRI